MFMRRPLRSVSSITAQAENPLLAGRYCMLRLTRFHQQHRLEAGA